MSKTDPSTINILHILFNEEAVLEFDRSKSIPEIQSQYLDNMDDRMNEGIQLGEDFIAPPNPLQKAQFVANSMVNALLKQDYNQAIAMCTYLGVRLSDLKQVICNGRDDDNGIKIEFVYDKDFERDSEVLKLQEQVIQFFDPKDYVKH